MRVVIRILRINYFLKGILVEKPHDKKKQNNQKITESRLDYINMWIKGNIT